MSGDENEYNFFMGNEVLNIFSFNNFFEKAIFWEKMGEKILRDLAIFFRRRGHHLTLKMYIQS